MPVLGVGSYIPAPKFAFPRSYLRGIRLAFNSDAVIVWAGAQVDFLDPPSGVDGRIIFDPRLIVWSSNSYSLDFCVIESWFRIPPSPSQLPLDFTLEWFDQPSFGRYIVFEPFGSVGSGTFLHDLPGAPPSYWNYPLWST